MAQNKTVKFKCTDKPYSLEGGKVLQIRDMDFNKLHQNVEMQTLTSVLFPEEVLRWLKNVWHIPAWLQFNFLQRSRQEIPPLL